MSLHYSTIWWNKNFLCQILDLLGLIQDVSISNLLSMEQDYGAGSAEWDVGDWWATFQFTSPILKNVMLLNDFCDLKFSFILGADSPAWVNAHSNILYQDQTNTTLSTYTCNWGNNWWEVNYADTYLENIDVPNISQISFGFRGYEKLGASLGRLTNMYFISK